MMWLIDKAKMLLTKLKIFLVFQKVDLASDFLNATFN